MKKTNKKLLFIIYSFGFLIILFFAIILFIWLKNYNIEKLTVKKISTYNLDNKSNLMIVAHPDDETLWGGKELLNGDWCVLCITNGNNKTRSDEFQNVMDYINCTGIILNYPDKVLNKRDDWKNIKDGIYDDVQTLIKYKNWDKIVTHNPKGEYKHIHHIMTNDIVTKNCINLNCYDKLYYFGKYYKKDAITNNNLPIKIDLNDKQKLDNMLELYTTQQKTLNKLKHMLYYESLIKADEWK